MKEHTCNARWSVIVTDQRITNHRYRNFICLDGISLVFFYPADGKLPVMNDICYESVPVQKPFLVGDDNVQSIDLYYYKISYHILIT